MIIAIRLIAVIMAGMALYVLYPDFGLRYLKITFFVILHDPNRWEFFKYFPLTILLTPILPSLELVSAYGLFKLRPWAWKVAVGALSCDFLFRFIGAINFVIMVMQYRNKPIPPIPKDAAFVVSMWPSYIIAFLCGIAIFILIQPSAKKILTEAYQAN